MKLATVLLLLFASHNLLAADVRLIEKDLLNALKKITYWAQYHEEDPKVHPSDSLSKANKAFNKKLLHYTSHEPSTLTYSFPSLIKAGLIVATSKDQCLRIYSWDDHEGGTMRYFGNVFQYKAGTKVLSRNSDEQLKEGDAQGFYSEIFCIKKDNKKIYLAVYNGVYSTKDCYQGIKAFSIEGSQLKSDIKIIKTQSGIKSQLGFYFDFFSVVDRKERPVKLITFDERIKAIKLPVVWENGKVTSKQIIYKFNGSVFEKGN